MSTTGGQFFDEATTRIEALCPTVTNNSVYGLFSIGTLLHVIFVRQWLLKIRYIITVISAVSYE